MVDTKVVLVPSPELRWNPVQYRFVTTDANGSFAFQAIPEDFYKIFAWENLPNDRDAALAGSMTRDPSSGAEFVAKYEECRCSVGQPDLNQSAS